MSGPGLLLPRIPSEAEQPRPLPVYPAPVLCRCNCTSWQKFPQADPDVSRAVAGLPEPNCILGVTPPWSGGFAYFPPGTAFLGHSPEGVTGPSLSLNLGLVLAPRLGGPWDTGSVTVWQRSEHWVWFSDKLKRVRAGRMREAVWTGRRGKDWQRGEGRG